MLERPAVSKAPVGHCRGRGRSGQWKFRPHVLDKAFVTAQRPDLLEFEKFAHGQPAHGVAIEVFERVHVYNGDDPMLRYDLIEPLNNPGLDALDAMLALE